MRARFCRRWAQAQSNAAIATPIGKVVSAKGTINVEHDSAVAVVVQASVGGRTKVGDLVYKGDVVSTGVDSALGITFSDGSAFNLSSNARMALNEFVYDPKGTSNATLFSLSKGTFTFIAGKVAKTGDMKIDTPIATMGIRGTTPHVEIRDDGSVAFSTLIEDKEGYRKKRGHHKQTAPNQEWVGSWHVHDRQRVIAPAGRKGREHRPKCRTARTTSMSRSAGGAERQS